MSLPLHEITVHKANPKLEANEISDVIIHISKDMPDYRWVSTDSPNAREIYTQDALKIYAALMKGLPGGTRMRLATLLLKEHTDNNVFIIPGIEERPDQERLTNDILKGEISEEERLARVQIESILHDAINDAFRRALHTAKRMARAEREDVTGAPV